MKLRLLFGALACLVFITVNPGFAAARRPFHSSAPEWVKNRVLYEVNVRQFSTEGSLHAVEQALPRLKAMGVGIVWLMPVHPIGERNRKGTLGSNYSIRDYTAINPEFGTREDFRSLVSHAHQLGMYVVMDWVANHTAWDHPWATQHRDYYLHDANGNFQAPFPGWDDVIKLNYGNPALRAEMTSAMAYWVRNFDIDGFRCDVAGMVPADFWNTAIAELRKLKPIFMLAESESRELLANGFDALYGSELYQTMMKIAGGELRGEEFWRALSKQRPFFSAGGVFMQFTTNHDENTWNGDLYERLGDYSAVFNALAFTLPGLPLIYSGQEAGLDKRLQFFEKDPIAWKDHWFRRMYTRLAELKFKNSALSNGPEGETMRRLGTTADGDIIAFVREKGADRVVVLANLSSRPISFAIPQLGTAPFPAIDVENGGLVDLFDGVSLHLEPWGFKVLGAGSRLRR